MTEAPIDLSRPAPPPLIPIRRLMADGVMSRRNFHKALPSRVVETSADSVTVYTSEQDRQRPWSQNIQERLRAPIVKAVQVERKVLRVCVNNNSMPLNSSPTEKVKSATALLTDCEPNALSESVGKRCWLASQGRSLSAPNVARSATETNCPRRKAMSEERVTKDSEADGRPTKRRRQEVEILESTNREGSPPDAGWGNHICRKSMTGRHVRSGTGAAPATLKGLRDKILSRRLPAAGDVR